MSAQPHWHADPTAAQRPVETQVTVDVAESQSMLRPAHAPAPAPMMQAAPMATGHPAGVPGNYGVGGPAADRPPQEQDADEDVWHGGLVNYYDSYGHLRRAPVAKRPFSERVLGCREFGRPMIWRAAFVEFIGTTLWVTWLCAGTIGISRFGYTNIGQFWYSLTTFLLYPLLIFSTTVASGGHLNPLITLATCFAGFTKVSRAFLYMLAQFAGGILAAALVWGWVTDADQDFFGAGNCATGPFMSRSMTLLIETVANFFFLFVVFGVALDPAQRVIFGPVLGPIFLSLALACIIFFTGLSGQYQGTWNHPARCFGASVISGVWTEEVWISIVAWVLSSLIMGVLYLLVPFNHEIRSRHHLAKERQLHYAQPAPVYYSR